MKTIFSDLDKIQLPQESSFRTLKAFLAWCIQRAGWPDKVRNHHQFSAVQKMLSEIERQPECLSSVSACESKKQQVLCMLDQWSDSLTNADAEQTEWLGWLIPRLEALFDATESTDTLIRLKDVCKKQAEQTATIMTNTPFWEQSHRNWYQWLESPDRERAEDRAYEAVSQAFRKSAKVSALPADLFSKD
jgi:hypothetical protein